MISYSVVEINQYGQAIGTIDLDEVDVEGGMCFYWNSVLEAEKEMRTHTISSAEAEKAYHKVKKRFPDKQFEIR